MKKCVAVFFSLFISLGCAGQSINITLRATINGESLRLEKTLSISDNDSVRINQLKFYMSNIQLLQDDQIVFSELNSFHLMDIGNVNSTLLNIKTFEPVSFNSIKFNVGIDSITNVAGAMGGDLDPTHGMYWTWQSGYINFKIEGVYNAHTSSSKEFQLHLGGYQTPFYNLQEVILNTNSSKVNIELDLDKFFNDIDVSQVNNIMSPSSKAVKLSALLAKSFKLDKNE